jgi:hypothetical protein
MSEVFVKMTEEEAARRWASNNGLCLIDWDTLEYMRDHVPPFHLSWNTDHCTYVLTQMAKEERHAKATIESS